MTTDIIRDHLVRLLSWQDAHVGFDAAIEGIPEALRGVQPAGLNYSLWQLLEHMRIAQHDILDFCRNPNYEEMAWPDNYWPQRQAPESQSAWYNSIQQFHDDNESLKQLALDPQLDLTSKIPHGSGQTYVRELLLVADHNAYHIGQLVIVRRLLGIW